MRVGLAVMAGAAGVVLFVGLVGVWVGRSFLPPGPGVPVATVPPITASPPPGATQLPDDHLAARLLSEGAGYDDLAEEAYTCARGGSSAGPYSACLVDDGGLMVVVPLRMAAGVEARLSGSAFEDEVTIPLPAVASEDSPPTPRDLFAVPHGEGRVRVELHYNGEPAGVVLSGGIDSTG